MNISKELLDQYIQTPEDPVVMLKLAEEYMNLNQPAGAYTYYIKCAEKSAEKDYSMRYHSLMMMSYIHHARGNTWLGSLQHARLAKTVQPDRPEAYYMIARVMTDKLTHDGVLDSWDWLHVYENAKIGCIYAKSLEVPKSRYWDGFETLAIYYCVGMLKMNMFIELTEFLSEYTFKELDNPFIYNTLIYIYDEIGVVNPYINIASMPVSEYFKSKLEEYAVDFNYSRNLQDIFALVMNQGKPGSYLEIGVHDSIYNNSTLLLKHGWNGYSLTNNVELCNDLNTKRSQGRAICTQYDYDYVKLAKAYNNHITYMSIDTGDMDSNYQVIYRFPWDTCKVDFLSVGRTMDNDFVDTLVKLGFSPIRMDVNYRTGDPVDSWFIRDELLNDEAINEIIGNMPVSNGSMRSLF